MDFAWHQSSSGSMPLEEAVDSSTSQTHATTNTTLMYALTGKGKHFMHYTLDGALSEQSVGIEKKCNCSF